MDEHNPFLALAKALWARGDDGEIIARDLANALLHIIKDGMGFRDNSQEQAAEFIRLTSQV